MQKRSFIRSTLSNHKRTRTQSPAFRLHRPFHSSPQYNGRSVKPLSSLFPAAIMQFSRVQPQYGNLSTRIFFRHVERHFFPLAPHSHLHTRCPRSRNFRPSHPYDFNNLRYFKFNRGERNAILDRILTYYRLHQPDISELRSPEILRAIFD